MIPGLLATGLGLVVLAALAGLFRRGRITALVCVGCAAAVVAIQLGLMWHGYGRPPLRTLGETRLWYAGLVLILGLGLEWRLGTALFRLPMLGFAGLFLALGLAYPDSFDRTLLPALRSPWFVPHVVVNLVAYAGFGLAGGAAAWALLRRRGQPTAEDLHLPLLLLQAALAFLTLGLVFGALWAKEAWGHYWSWDPKETWAWMSWCVAVAAMHGTRRAAPTVQAWGLVAALAVILLSWFLTPHLPAAQVSVHTYGWN
jgi:ABC-type transport system involved in cytochrome c biogenesis permease subunit